MSKQIHLNSQEVNSRGRAQIIDLKGANWTLSLLNLYLFVILRFQPKYTKDDTIWRIETEPGQK